MNSSSFMASSRKTLLLQVIINFNSIVIKSSLNTPGIGYYSLNTGLIHPKIIKNIKIKKNKLEK